MSDLRSSRWTLLVVIAGLVAGARSAQAYSDPATDWIAGQVLAALPGHARLVVRTFEVEMASERLRFESEADPENAELMRRCQWPVIATTAGESSAPQPSGGAVAAFTGAQRQLADAWKRSDRAAAASAIARLAQSAADLADPFVISAPDAGEADGARAWFSDAVTQTELAELSLEGVGSVPWSASAPVRLAIESAAIRAPASAAAEAEDGAAIVSLRAERLRQAAALAIAATRAAWKPAPATSLGRLRMEPNPLRGPVTLWLELPVAEQGVLELFDVSGRRALSRPLGLLPAGRQRQELPGEWMSGLPAGLYLARVTAGAVRAEARCTLLAGGSGNSFR